MSTQNRLPVVPTVTVLTVMKARLVGATRGHALLKKKADALTMRFRQLLKEIIEAKENLGSTMKSSFFAYTEAQYAAGEKVKHTIMDNVETAMVKVRGGLDNVAGVKIPRFESFVLSGETKMDLTGGLQVCAPGVGQYGYTVDQTTGAQYRFFCRPRPRGPAASKLP